VSDARNEIVTAALDDVASGRDLDAGRAAAVLAEIMRGEVSHTQIAGFLIALRTKGETVEELAGLARTMRAFAVPVHAGAAGLLDTAGTGGGASSFNVSTTAALIAAGAGCPVAKHGNRSATSLSGSADVLEALGARIDLGAEEVARCIDQVGFGFIFAPAHHPATRYVVGVRAELGVRTVFNLLGPLTNPAGATRQLVGVSDPRHLETIAGALVLLGVERALVVAGEDGLDEISAVAPTRIVEVEDGSVRAYTVSPTQLGIADGASGASRGGTPQDNAAVTRAILAGERGPQRDLALVNAGAAIYAAGAAGTLAEGVELARAAVDDGRAAALLERWVEATRACASSPRSSPARARTWSAAAARCRSRPRGPRGRRTPSATRSPLRGSP
jgi:anthranilate phosphoribosyltransferase